MPPKHRGKLVTARPADDPGSRASSVESHGARHDAITMEPLDPQRSVAVESPDGSLTLHYNISTLIRIALEKQRYLQPPHFREPMARGLRADIEAKHGKLPPVSRDMRDYVLQSVNRQQESAARGGGASAASGGGGIDVDDDALVDEDAGMAPTRRPGLAEHAADAADTNNWGHYWQYFAEAVADDDNDDDQAHRGVNLEYAIRLSTRNVHVCPECYEAARRRLLTKVLALVLGSLLVEDLDGERAARRLRAHQARAYVEDGGGHGGGACDAEVEELRGYFKGIPQCLHGEERCLRRRG